MRLNKNRHSQFRKTVSVKKVSKVDADEQAQVQAQKADTEKIDQLQEPGSTKKVEGETISFSLRSFLTTLVLMSHCTVDEKIGILFDLYDWVDGTGDGNMPSTVFEIV